MPAPDLQTLYKVEDAIEAAWKTVLQAEGLTAFKTRDDDVLTLPRVDILVALGGATGHRGLRAPGQFALDAWAGQVTLQVKTKRVSDQPETHADWVAEVRLAAQYFEDRLGASVLPFHALSMVQESGTERSVGDDDETDISAISFDFIVSIRSNAWPS
jgi:hypothetical protein